MSWRLRVLAARWLGDTKGRAGCDADTSRRSSQGELRGAYSREQSHLRLRRQDAAVRERDTDVQRLRHDVWQLLL